MKDIRYTEVHLYAAPVFSQVFRKVTYSWLLCLTATLERLDGKHALLEHYAPICDTVTQKEAILNGWVSDFIQFNLAVPITPKEANEQVNLGKQIRYYMSRFGDFNNMLSCMDRRNAARYALILGIEPPEVIKWATNGLRLIRKRKDFLDNTQHKIGVAIELIKEFNVRTITFSQSTQFVDELQKQLGDTAVAYHSNMESKLIPIEKSKVFKTILAAEKFKRKLNSKNIPYKLKKSPTIIITWSEFKSTSGSTLAKQNLKDFVEGKVRVLLSAKALDQGVDVPDVQLGIDGSRSENPATHTQKRGRIGRISLRDGKPIPKVYINLYVPDWSVPNSRDEQKLRKCQKDCEADVYWVDDFQELKDMLQTILKDRNTEM